MENYSYEALLNNIILLEKQRKKNSEVYVKIIKGGISYYPYEIDGELYFAPSKFLGNPTETIDDGYFGGERDTGFETNKRISNLVGFNPTVSEEIFGLFEKFYVNVIGENPSRVGSFGRERKFWRTADVLEFLNRNELNQIRVDESITPAQRTALIEARIGQGRYRANLLDYWNSQCAVTGCDMPELLIASHIKPWRDSDNKEKLDVYNGLLLSPTYDKLFDKFLISFNEEGEIMISELLSEENQERLGITGEEHVELAPEHQYYIEYHNAQFAAQQ